MSDHTPEGIVRIAKREHMLLSVFVPPLSEKEWDTYHSELYPITQLKRDEQGFIRAAVYDYTTFDATQQRAERSFGNFVGRQAMRIGYDLMSEVVIDMAALGAQAAKND